MKTTNLFKKRTDLYTALVKSLNDLVLTEEFQFRFRYYGATTAQELPNVPSGFVEPGAWKIDRISRGSARRFETARILYEGHPYSSDELRLQIEVMTDFLDAIANIDRPDASRGCRDADFRRIGTRTLAPSFRRIGGS